MAEQPIPGSSGTSVNLMYFHNIAKGILEERLKMLVASSLSLGLSCIECEQCLRFIVSTATIELYPQTAREQSSAAFEVSKINESASHRSDIEMYPFEVRERSNGTEICDQNGQVKNNLRPDTVLLLTRDEFDMLMLIRICNINIACLSTLAYGVACNYSRERYSVETEDIDSSSDDDEVIPDRVQVTQLIEQSKRNKEILSHIQTLVQPKLNNELEERYDKLLQEVLDLRSKLSRMETRSIGVNTCQRDNTRSISSNTDLSGEVMKPTSLKRRPYHKYGTDCNNDTQVNTQKQTTATTPPSPPQTLENLANLVNAQTAEAQSYESSNYVNPYPSTNIPPHIQSQNHRPQQSYPQPLYQQPHLQTGHIPQLIQQSLNIQTNNHQSLKNQSLSHQSLSHQSLSHQSLSHQPLSHPSLSHQTHSQQSLVSHQSLMTNHQSISHHANHQFVEENPVTRRSQRERIVVNQGLLPISSMPIHTISSRRNEYDNSRNMIQNIRYHPTMAQPSNVNVRHNYIPNRLPIIEHPWINRPSRPVFHGQHLQNLNPGAAVPPVHPHETRQHTPPNYGVYGPQSHGYYQ